MTCANEQGAEKAAISLYQALQDDLKSSACPTVSWSDAEFTLMNYDLVFLPGGHEKGVVQVINSPRVHQLIAEYFPQTRKPSKKSISAICHGVMVLSETSGADGKCIIHDATTTALPAMFEQSIFWGTRLVLGDYYKTYGAGSESVEQSVTKRLDQSTQFRSSLGFKP